MDVSVNIDDLPEYKTGMQFAEKTKVKVMGLDGVWYSGTVTPVKTGGCIFVADDVEGYKDATGNGIKYGKTIWNSLWNYAYQTIYGIEDLGISGIEIISGNDLSEYHEIIDEASNTVYNELKNQSPYSYGFDGLNVLINTASIGFGAVEMAGNGAIAATGISNIVGGNADGYEGGSYAKGATNVVNLRKYKKINIPNFKIN